MTTLVFDTLQFAKKLKEAGVPEKQAEIQAEAMAEIVEEKLASKHDVKQLELSIKAEFNLKIAELKSELIKWVLGISVAQAAIIISCLKLIH